MMSALLLDSYRCGIYSSRRIAKACREASLRNRNSVWLGSAFRIP
jgi:hypothetical protein